MDAGSYAMYEPSPPPPVGDRDSAAYGGVEDDAYGGYVQDERVQQQHAQGSYQGQPAYGQQQTVYQTSQPVYQAGQYGEHPSSSSSNPKSSPGLPNPFGEQEDGDEDDEPRRVLKVANQ